MEGKTLLSASVFKIRYFEGEVQISIDAMLQKNLTGIMLSERCQV